jgi:hypothetical protein
MIDINAVSYGASVFFVAVGVVYGILLVSTLLSVLLIPIALIFTPFISIFLIVSLLTIPTFPQTFTQVLKGFVDKVKAVHHQVHCKR